MHVEIQKWINFTLIELLIVIAILAILTGLLLPALNSARDKGYSAKCIGNLKQQGLAFQQYADDMDSWMPVSSADVTYGVHYYWRYAIAPYLGIRLGQGEGGRQQSEVQRQNPGLLVRKDNSQWRGASLESSQLRSGGLRSMATQRMGKESGSAETSERHPRQIPRVRRSFPPILPTLPSWAATSSPSHGNPPRATCVWNGSATGTTTASTSTGPTVTLPGWRIPSEFRPSRQPQILLAHPVLIFETGVFP